MYFFFNALLVLSCAVIFFMPFFMLGWSYVKVFWTQNWYIAAAFLIVITAFNIFFLRNWHLFSLLGNEDWKGARRCLEQLIYEKKRESGQTIRFLINTCIVLADTSGIERLARHLEETKSRFFAVFALELGIPYMTRAPSAGSEAYFARAAANPKARKRGWLRWNLALARMREGGKGVAAAAEDLAALAGETKDPALLLLTAYLLDSCDEIRNGSKKLAASIRAALKQKYTPSAWEKISQRLSGDIAGLILSKSLDAAKQWLFENEE
jgi:hypothetical protein